jgi:tRNA modification GTPase
VTDTIVALSSGTLPSGVAVIRVSGPRTADLVTRLTGGLPQARRLTLADLRDGTEIIDRGLVAWFPGPQSFTGEDCAEFQVHGSPAVVRSLLRLLSSPEGTRLAEAGEFTRRAFENGKLDLTEVEGLGDLIAAETETQRKQALARLSGGIAAQVIGWRERLLDLRAEVEAQLDFSDEGDVGDLPHTFLPDLQSLRAELSLAIESVTRGRIVREGLRVALAGPPNAGKSSLLNALARTNIAIVTDEPGTTRDVREVHLDLGGHLVVLIDMAGLRDTSSKAEAEGVRRARDEIAGADLVLWLDAPDVGTTEEPERVDLRLATKADLGTTPTGGMMISAKTGLGLDSLEAWLNQQARDHMGSGEPALLSRERDRSALERAVVGLDLAVSSTELELTAEGLRQASQALERLLGTLDAEAVLDRLFLGFCIGK